jgi:ribosomal protein S18 acetylase RimI-like enzyme
MRLGPNELVLADGKTNGDAAPRVGVVSRLDSSQAADFDALVRLYTATMPERERKPADEISRMLGRPDYRVFLLKEADSLLGYGIVFVPPGEALGLLEYFAIDAAQRGLGLGGKLFAHLAQKLARESQVAALLLEVDSDREPSPDQPIRKKRQIFYRRLGCLRIENLPYILPLPGKGAPPQMDLMVHFSNRPQSLAKPLLAHWLRLIYRDVYQCAEKDPRLAAMLVHVGEPVELS